MGRHTKKDDVSVNKTTVKRRAGSHQNIRGQRTGGITACRGRGEGDAIAKGKKVGDVRKT